MEQILGQGIEIFYKVKAEFINNCPCLKRNEPPPPTDPNQAYGQPGDKPSGMYQDGQTQDGFNQLNGGVYEMQPYANENGTGYANPNEMQFEEEEGFDEFKSSEKISEWQAG